MTERFPTYNGVRRYPEPNNDWIQSIKGKHSGDEVVLLGNGPSLAQHPLDRIPSRVLTFGMNASWKVVPNATYHFAIDRENYDMHQEYYDALAREDRLFTLKGWPVGQPVLHGMPPEVRFSRDLVRGLRVSMPLNSEAFVDGERRTSTGSVMYAVLQVCAWMDFAKIWIVGMDMEGGKFDGRRSPYVILHDALYQHVPVELQQRIQVIAPSKTKVFEIVEWPWDARTPRGSR